MRRRRVIDLDRVRTRLYNICLDGEDHQAIQAARVLLGEKRADAAASVDSAFVDELMAALAPAPPPDVE